MSKPLVSWMLLCLALASELGCRYSSDTDGDGDGVPAGEDCDDDDPEVHPGAEEICDGVDNDCDGVVDDAGLSWFADEDGDGFGAGEPRLACAQPSGFVADATDCDDNLPSVYPGSHEIEVPFDGVDTDCDGDDFCSDPNCDGWPDLVFANKQSDTEYEVDSYVYFGSEDGFSADRRADLPTMGVTGVSVADLDQDGYPDIVFSNSRSSAGWEVDSYIYWGSATGFSEHDRTGLPTLTAQDNTIADVNGDGYLDIVFSNLWNGSSNVAESYVYYGSASGFSAENRDELPTIGASGNSAADLDGDGYVDLVFSNRCDQSLYRLDSYIYWGSASGFSAHDRTGLPTVGATGNNVADLDDDGFLDIVFSSWTDGVESELDSFVYWGSAEGFSVDDRDALPTKGACTNSLADMDGDGFLDIVFSNMGDGINTVVDSIIYWGSASGFSEDDTTGLPTLGAVGNTVADLDQDGFLDLVFANHTDGRTMNVASVVFWGAKGGYSQDDYTVLTTLGALGVASQPVANPER